MPLIEPQVEKWVALTSVILTGIGVCLSWWRSRISAREARKAERLAEDANKTLEKMVDCLAALGKKSVRIRHEVGYEADHEVVKLHTGNYRTHTGLGVNMGVLVNYGDTPIILCEENQLPRAEALAGTDLIDGVRLLPVSFRPISRAGADFTHGSYLLQPKERAQVCATLNLTGIGPQTPRFDKIRVYLPCSPPAEGWKDGQVMIEVPVKWGD
jgi:hypothetical protein